MKVPNWQPIETAPKDGTPILLRSKKGRVADGLWMVANSNCGAWVWAYVNVEPAYWMPLPKATEVGADSTAEPNCDRSACGDFKPGPCDNPDCPAIGKPQTDMIAMENAQGKKFALKFNPTHSQHGWIFYDNHGRWVTLRRALPHEIERAKGIIEMREVLAGVPCRA